MTLPEDPHGQGSPDFPGDGQSWDIGDILGRSSSPEIGFPEPRIELTAQLVIDGLDALDESLTDLAERRKREKDTLQGLKRNHTFIRDRVIPIVKPLMDRSLQGLFFDNARICGYGFLEIESEQEIPVTSGEELDIRFLVNDGMNYRTVDNDPDIQKSWDTSAILTRSVLRVVGGFSKEEIISIFKSYASEYADSSTRDQ